MERSEASSVLTIGGKLPSFTLPGTDGDSYSESYFQGGQASLVIFTCNHCPYVKGSEDEMNQVIEKYLDQGLKVLAISANDAEQYPEDSFAKMKEKSLPYPYLYDESQAVAKSFDAACTPECFLFNAAGELAFHGTINDSPRHQDQVSQSYLAQAIDQVISDGQATPSFVHPLGCSIKWKA